MNKKIRILMCGSELAVKGGMVSVIKNYLEYDKWEDFHITYIPTHIEKNKFQLALYFGVAYLRILLYAIFGHYDVLYLHTAERGSFYRKAILARTLRKFGIETVMHHHAAEFEKFYAGLTAKKRNFVKETLELVSLNIVLSNRLIPMITDKAPKASVAVLYNAVNTYEKNPYNENSQNLLFLGRLGARKGTYDLLRAIKELDDVLPTEVKVNLCGDGDVEGVNAKVKEYGIEHRIVHIGWIDNNQKRDFMENSMVNVLPSYNEGLPMSILETMAYGIPNISTNIASIPEVIHDNINGYMVLPGDIEGLKKDILSLCCDEKLRVRFSWQAWRDINEKFAIDAHISQLKQYLQKLV